MHPAALFYESSLRSLFPPVKFAFAYGSAVFQQQGRPKVDRIVSYPSLQFHVLALELPNHAQGEGLMSGTCRFVKLWLFDLLMSKDLLLFLLGC